MALTTASGRANAGRAGRGDLRATETVIRDLVDHFDGTSTTELAVLSALTATAVELNTYTVSLDIADGSAEAVYYVVCPHAGSISKIWTVIDGAVGTANITITGAIGGTGITTGVVTIATAASAAGDIDSCVPSALNVVTAGQAVNFTVTGGGAGGTPRVHLVMEILR